MTKHCDYCPSLFSDSYTPCSDNPELEKSYFYCGHDVLYKERIIDIETDEPCIRPEWCPIESEDK